MSLKAAVFGTFLLIFLTVVLFAIQSSETQATNRTTCEGGGPDGGWSACEVGYGRECGTGYKTCLDSHSSRYDELEPCTLDCPNNQTCHYNARCTQTVCREREDGSFTVCAYGDCDEEPDEDGYGLCIGECNDDDDCYPIPQGYSPSSRVSCYRAKCSYISSGDDDDSPSYAYPTPGGGSSECPEGTRYHNRGPGCGYECLASFQEPTCDECPSCPLPRIKSTNSNCGATRTTRCEGGCTTWTPGVDCNQLGRTRGIDLSCEYSRCDCSDRTTCLDSRRFGIYHYLCRRYERERNGGGFWNRYWSSTMCHNHYFIRAKWVRNDVEYVCRSGVGNASSLSFDKRRVCFNGTWQNVHTNGSACAVALRAAGANPDWHLAKSGIVRVDWDYRMGNSMGRWLCPIPPLALRNRSCWPGIDCGLNSSGDIAVCSEGSDCVFEGRCYPSANRLLDGARDLRRTLKAHGVTVVADVDNGSEGWEYCDRGSWRGVSGGLRGQVTNTSWHPVQGARVTVLGAGSTAITDAGGYYYISDIPVRSLTRLGYGSTSYGDVIAEDLSGTYDPAVSKNLQVRAFENTTRNFVLKRPLGRDCNDDCTDHRGVCSPRCHGTGACLFNSQESMEICDGYFEGGYGDRVNGSQKRRVLCCKGEAFEPEKVVIELCEGLEDVARVQKSVLFRGRFVTMNVLMFDGKQCKSKPIPHALR